MRIREILDQNRRDFSALFECEHCGATQEMEGYDDDHFHNLVIPALTCPACGKSASDSYRARKPRYPEGVAV